MANVPKPGRFLLSDFLALSGEFIDRGLVLAFKEGASFTGEEVVEFQTHGSLAVVSQILAELGRIDGFRLAEPGEFTRRALENGRMSLSEVEGLADLLNAETATQHRLAVKMFGGELRQTAERWTGDLIRARALIEASLDFADEDVPEDVVPEVRDLIGAVLSEIDTAIAGSANSESIRTGFEVAIVGQPNVGKSTLINKLAGREAAIVNEAAGTTRDIVEVHIDLNGLLVTFFDTAGIRATADSVERTGIQRALERADAADLRVVLKTEEAETPQIQLKDGDIVKLTKGDLFPGEERISAVSGLGIEDLRQQIFDVLSGRVQRNSPVGRVRQREGLMAARDRLLATSSLTDGELIAFELKSAIDSLGFVVGKIDVERVLDDVFGEFCLGK